MKFKILTLFLLGNLITSVCLSQTTGKIIGKISDVETSEVLIGVNIMLLGTNLGIASDINGEFFLLNLPPGSYNLSVSMIGGLAAAGSIILMLL